MFYATQIKSVHAGGAVDVSGRSLRFIGYLPVKAGDTVYTDGRFIFGNAPPKGAPAIFDEQGGIPVLAYNLRGYFTLQGKFKDYRIAGTDWIVNDKNNYKHDVQLLSIVCVRTDGELLTVEKNVIPFAADDYDYHNGFYTQTPAPLWQTINFGRIAVCCEGDSAIFYNYPVVGFQSRYYEYASHYYYSWLHIPFYYSTGISAYNSYDDGYYSAFKNDNAGYGIAMRTCWFLLRGQDLDYRNFDNKIIKQCEFIIRKNGEIFQRIAVSDLLKSFEDTAKAEVDIFPDRESVKHIKSRAIVHNFKILSDCDWAILIEAEIWASNTFYENNEEAVSHDPLILDTNPFHISSTISHNHLIIKFKADGTFEEIFKWKFLYPLQIRDSTFGQYYDTKPESFSVEEGAWIVRTMTAEVDEGRWSTAIWRDYDSRREFPDREYNTPLLKLADNFSFPVQNEFNAIISNAYHDIQQWRLSGIFDADNNQVVRDFLPDETDAHKWNMSLAKLKGGGYLVGIRDDDDRGVVGALYKITDNSFELVGNGLKNFRLRELKNISKSKK